MARFNFRLDSVLRYRQRLKQEKQWEIDALIAARVRIENEIDALQQRLARSDEAVMAAPGRLLMPVELRLHGNYACETTRRIGECREKLKECHGQIAEKRRELIEAMRDVKALEQLRSRLEEKFRREQNLEEQKLADEIAQMKFADPTRKKLPG